MSHIQFAESRTWVPSWVHPLSGPLGAVGEGVGQWMLRKTHPQTSWWHRRLRADLCLVTASVGILRFRLGSWSYLYFSLLESPVLTEVTKLRLTFRALHNLTFLFFPRLILSAFLHTPVISHTHPLTVSRMWPSVNRC